MRAVLLIVVLSITGCVHQDEWTSRDTYLQLGVSAVIIADAVTTAQIQHYPGITERGLIAGPILGDNPSTTDTYLYFSTVLIGNYFITRALPTKWRPYWQSATIIEHSAATINNCNRGLC